MGAIHEAGPMGAYLFLQIRQLEQMENWFSLRVLALSLPL